MSCDWIITGEDILVEESDTTSKEKKITISRGTYLTLLATTLVCALCAVGVCAYLIYSLI